MMVHFAIVCLLTVRIISGENYIEQNPSGHNKVEAKRDGNGSLAPVMATKNTTEKVTDVNAAGENYGTVSGGHVGRNDSKPNVTSNDAPTAGPGRVLLWEGKPTDVTEPNAAKRDVAVPPPAPFTSNDTAPPKATADHQPHNPLDKLHNSFKSSNGGNRLTGHPLDDYNYDYDVPSTDNAESSSTDYSDTEPAEPIDDSVRSDFIDPKIYSQFSDLSGQNKFANIEDFNGPRPFGNALNPFNIFNPFTLPFGLMLNSSQSSSPHLNHPWNPNNINEALLRLSTLSMMPPLNFAARFNLPPVGIASLFARMFNTPTSPKLDLFNVLPNESALPIAFSPTTAGNDGSSRQQRVLHVNSPSAAPPAKGVNESSSTNMDQNDIHQLATNSSSQATLLRFSSATGNWLSGVSSLDNTTNPTTPTLLSAAKFSSAAASAGNADDAQSWQRQPDAESAHRKLVNILKPKPRSSKSAPITDDETISEENAPDNYENHLYDADDPQIALGYRLEATFVDDMEPTNGSPAAAAEVSQNSVIVLLSSWMMVIGIVVGVIAQKLCSKA